MLKSSIQSYSFIKIIKNNPHFFFVEKESAQLYNSLASTQY